MEGIIMNNLESIINKVAFDIVNNKILGKNEVNKLLGILSNDGVYAMWVYAKAEKNINEKELMKQINLIFNIVDQDKMNSNSENFLKNLEYFQNFTEDLNKLLFMKDILEKVFIYARYHANAIGDQK